METVVRANINYYQKLLENETEPDKRSVLLAFLADETLKLEIAIQSTNADSPRFRLSEVSLNGCKNQAVRESILKLRRGPIRHAKGKTIFYEGEPARYVMIVVDGVVRACTTFEDGTRAIAEFYLPGDIVGLSDQLHSRLSAEAASDTVAIYVKRSELIELAVQNKDAAEFLFATMSREILHSQDRVVLSRKEATQRVAAFLFDVWTRLNRPQQLSLPMDYMDAANHLDLTNETFSRCLAVLENANTIARISGRRIILRNRTSLVRSAS